MKIAIGNDHAGTAYKEAIVRFLEKEGIKVTNYGTNKGDSVDYPDFVHPVAEDVEAKKWILELLSAEAEMVLP